MEQKALALRSMVKKHLPTTEDINPRNWMKHENVREFADFILNKNMDIDTDDSFDNKEMGEYARTRK